MTGPRWWRGGHYNGQHARPGLFFFSPPTGTVEVHEAMAAGAIGLIDTPKQSQEPPPGVRWCADNGCFTDRWDADKWWYWLNKRIPNQSTCVFATAPDVLRDAEATLPLALKWMPKIRGLGYKVAYVAQNGDSSERGLPWDEFDVLFIGGDDVFKFSPESLGLIRDGKERGKHIHMGRINSLRRWRIAEAYNADSADGTILTRAPSENLLRVTKWNADLVDRPALFQL